MVDFARKGKFNIADVFVGREEELENLVDFWHFCQDTNENKAYVLLNAPGVGKSVLLKKFGKLLQEKNEGLFIKYDSAIPAGE